MPKRIVPGAIRRIGWRLSSERDEAVPAAYTFTRQLGDGTSIEPADPTETFGTGVTRPAGAGYNVTVNVKDPALWAGINAAQMNHDLLDIVVEYKDADSTQIVIQDVGFTASKLRTVGSGTFEGFSLTGFGYGADSDDVLVITPALPAAV